MMCLKGNGDMFCSSNVLKEILDTERKYVDDLKYLCEVGRVIT